MTVVAYRDGILAVDRQASVGGVKCPVSKLHTKETTEGVIAFTYTGMLDAGVTLVDWAMHGEKASLWPTAMQSNESTWCRLIVLHPTKGLYMYESQPVPIMLVKDQFYGFGSGSGVALGALHMGATAVQAVEAAIMYSDGCGYGVDTFEIQQRS